jgi:hypothetical protein
LGVAHCLKYMSPIRPSDDRLSVSNCRSILILAERNTIVLSVRPSDRTHARTNSRTAKRIFTKLNIG